MLRLMVGSAVLLACLLLLAGCESVGFYGQAVAGHLSLMLGREPIDRVLASSNLDARERDRLRLISSVRDYAARTLGLPVGDSYSTYVDTGRPYVVWNIFASPEFSIDPVTWCFPIAGCVAYRGYFSRERAVAAAEKLRLEGYDVYLGGSAAYSTLGWFSDPVLNTFLDRSDTEIAALIFHEVAHKILYLPGDTTFNESFATAVEGEAVRRWLLDRGEGQMYQDYVAEQRRGAEFAQLVTDYQGRFRELYRKPGSDAEKRAAKAEMITRFRGAYRELRSHWQGQDDFGGWMEAEINNAKLASLASYNDLVPGLQALLVESGGDLERFFNRCRELAKLDSQTRAARLRALPSPG